MEQAGVQLIAQGASAFNSDLKAATNATNTFVDATDKGGGRVSAAGQVMIGALRQVGVIAVQAFGQALRAGAAFIGDSIELAGDFDQTMSVLQATSEATAEQMEDVSAKAKALGSDLTLPATSAVDAGKAMLELSKAGFTVAESMDAAKGVLQLAAAAQIDEAKAAEINANAINAFNLEAKDSIFISDLLAASANASSVEITDVADSFTMAAAVFSNFQGPVVGSKQSIIDLTTAVGLLGNAGIKGSDAGTALKQSLLQLTAPSDKAKGLMKDLAADIGVTGDIAYDAQGVMRSFPEILGLVSASTKSLSDEQRNYIISTIFGADATRAILVLMNEGPDAWAKMETAVTRQGAASDLAAAQTEGYKGALEGAKSQAETLQLTIGQALTPVLAELLNNYISPGIAAITAFADSFLKMVPAIVASDDPLQTFLNALKIAAPGMLDTISAIEDFKDGFLGIVDSAKPVTDFIGDNLTPILFGVGTAITVAVVPALIAATGAFLAAAAPVVALVAAGALLYKAWETDFLGIKTTVTQVWNDTLLPAFKDIQAWLAEKIPPAIKTLSGFWTDTLQPALQEVWGFLKDKVFPVLSDLTDLYIAAAIIEVKALATMWTTILQPALKAVWDFMSGSVIPIFKALFEVNWAIATKAVEAMAGLWQNVLQPAFKSVGDFVTSTVVPAFKSVGDYLNTTFGPILTDVGTWLSDVTGGFEGVSGGVKDVIKWLSDLATSISTLKLPSWLTPGSPTPWETALYGIGTALQKSVAPGLSAMRAGIGEIGTGISDTFASGNMIDNLMNLGEDMMNGLAKGLNDGMSVVVHEIDDIASGIEDRFKEKTKTQSPSKMTEPIGGWIVEGLLIGMQNMWPSVTEMVATMAEDLIEQAADIGRDVQGVIADAFSSTASIDRQMAKNLEATAKIPEGFYRKATELQLSAAADQAKAFADPATGAKFFAMRSKQILEFQELQQKINEETDADTKKRLQQQQILILAAQEAEQSAFSAQFGSQESPIKDIAKQLAELFNNAEVQKLQKEYSEADSDEERARIMELIKQAAIAVNDTGVGHDLNEIMRQLEIFTGMYVPPGTASPPASGAQMPAPAGTSTSSTKTYNMPIYTNNTPAALQQSLAIANAVLA